MSGNARIVSLVPSLTELICDLGLIDQLVGRTGFCVHPKQLLRAVPKVGGTKTVDIERVRALKPSHVIVNIDENEKPTVELLREFVAHVVVTHPIAIADNLALYQQFGELFNASVKAAQLSERLAAELAALSTSSFAARNVVYIIWKAPWMTISSDTYIAKMLASVGLTTMTLAGRSERYPSFEWSQFALAQCDAVLLSSEPYRFTAKHLDLLACELLVQAVQPSSAVPVPLLRLIDGEMTSWYGSRAIAGLQYLRQFRQQLDQHWPQPRALALNSQ